LNQYGIIYIFTHGSSGYNGEYIDTGYEMTPDRYRKWQDIVLIPQESFVDKTKKRFGISVKNTASVGSLFFLRSIDTMPSSLVYINGCETLKRGDLPTELLKKGAGAYLGNSENSFAFLTKGVSETVFNELLHGKTVGSLSSLFQVQDPVFGSFLDLRGNGGLKIVKNEISLADTTMDTEAKVELQATFANPTGSDSTQKNLLQWSVSGGSFASDDVQYDCSAGTQCSGTVRYTAPKDAGEYTIEYSHIADSNITASATVKVNASNKIGSCTVYTVPKDPNPNQNYDIKIEIPISDETSATVVSGTVIGDDGFNETFNESSVNLPTVNNTATLSINIPGAEDRVSDLITVDSPLECKGKTKIVF